MATATEAPSSGRRRPKKSETDSDTPRTVSQAHKDAMRLGREESAVVARYLEALEAEAQSQPRGRRRNPETMEARLAEIARALTDTSTKPLSRLALIQERQDLQAHLERLASVTETDIEALTQRFTEVAASYSARKGFSYSAWREVGVPANVLRDAGIARS